MPNFGDTQPCLSHVVDTSPTQFARVSRRKHHSMAIDLSWYKHESGCDAGRPAVSRHCLREWRYEHGSANGSRGTVRTQSSNTITLKSVVMYMDVVRQVATVRDR